MAVVNRAALLAEPYNEFTYLLSCDHFNCVFVLLSGWSINIDWLCAMPQKSLFWMHMLLLIAQEREHLQKQVEIVAFLVSKF